MFLMIHVNIVTFFWIYYSFKFKILVQKDVMEMEIAFMVFVFVKLDGKEVHAMNVSN